MVSPGLLLLLLLLLLPCMLPLASLHTWKTGWHQFHKVPCLHHPGPLRAPLPCPWALCSFSCLASEYLHPQGPQVPRMADC